MDVVMMEICFRGDDGRWFKNWIQDPNSDVGGRRTADRRPASVNTSHFVERLINKKVDVRFLMCT